MTARRNPLPCEKLHCELLARLSKPLTPSTLPDEQLQQAAARIIMLFQQEPVLMPLEDGLIVLEYVKATIIEFLHIRLEGEMKP